MIGEFVETVEELLTPTTDFALHALPFLRYLPGTYYKRLCDKVFKTRAAIMKELLDRAKVFFLLIIIFLLSLIFVVVFFVDVFDIS